MRTLGRSIRLVGTFAAALALALVVGSQPAYAATTGNIAGTVVDKATDKPLPGVTVTVQGPALQGEQTEFSDSSGRYIITELPPGEYVVRFYFSNKVVERPGVVLFADQTLQVNGAIPTADVATQTYRIVEKAPTVDVGNTQVQTQVTSEFVKNMPVIGRNFTSVLTLAPGAATDAVGFSFNGATGPENNFLIDGLNTTNPAFGTVGTTLSLEFIKETEIITGGYNAEYGRATGGIVNVITKSGSNEFHGDAWLYYTPFQLDPERVARFGEAIASQSKTNYAFDFGFDLGGPIIKDRLWFFAGFNPQYSELGTTRILRSRTATMVPSTFMGGADAAHATNYAGDIDKNAACPDYLKSVSPALCPAAGFITKDLDSKYFSNLARDSHQYQYIAKLNLQINENNFMALEYIGNIASTTGRNGSLNGSASQMFADLSSPTHDIIFHMINKLLDKRLQIDVVAGYHYESTDTTPTDPSGNAQAVTGPGSKSGVLDTTTNRSLADYGEAGGATGPCAIQKNFNNIMNANFNPCPVTNYTYGGWGFYDRTTNQRLNAAAGVTYFARLAGTHALKIGADFEYNSYEDFRNYTGGMEMLTAGSSPANSTVELYRQFGTVDKNGNVVRLTNGFSATTITENEGFYARDSWSVGFVPGLTINAGVRWELQQVQGNDGSTQISINDNIAPRVGFIYDFTRKGYSKIYASYGRFYESIPLDLNDRQFSGEGLLISAENSPGQYKCNDTTGKGWAPGALLDPSTCKLPPAARPDLNGGTYGAVSPVLKGQYSNEVIAGLQYDVGYDLVVGAAYQHRDLGRIIEDMSPDGGNTYIIANPGDPTDTGAVSDLQSQINDLNKQISAAKSTDAKATLETTKAQKVQTLALYEQVESFDKPKRDYNALVLTANKRLTHNFQILASYTYSRTLGNYPGLFQASNGQLDPNISTQYDLRELLLNRYGPLPNDRPHNLKLNGSYLIPLGAQGGITLSLSANWLSGTPIEVLGRHPTYGRMETFILQRGSGGRTPDLTSLDLHAGYQREFTKSLRAELYLDVFNLLDEHTVTTVDNEYTTDRVEPIANGSYADLAHLKSTSGTAVHVAANYGNATSYQAPLSMRVGLRVSF